jgi:hypothetical protein
MPDVVTSDAANDLRWGSSTRPEGRWRDTLARREGDDRGAPTRHAPARWGRRARRNPLRQEPLRGCVWPPDSLRFLPPRGRCFGRCSAWRTWHQTAGTARADPECRQCKVHFSGNEPRCDQGGEQMSVARALHVSFVASSGRRWRLSRPVSAGDGGMVTRSWPRLRAGAVRWGQRTALAASVE